MLYLVDDEVDYQINVQTHLINYTINIAIYFILDNDSIHIEYCYYCYS
jgi:hypothetical protein